MYLSNDQRDWLASQQLTQPQRLSWHYYHFPSCESFGNAFLTHFLGAALIRIQFVEDIVVHAGEVPYAGYQQILVAIRPRRIGAEPCHLLAEQLVQVTHLKRERRGLFRLGGLFAVAVEGGRRRWPSRRQLGLSPHSGRARWNSVMCNTQATELMTVIGAPNTYARRGIPAITCSPGCAIPPSRRDRRGKYFSVWL